MNPFIALFIAADLVVMIAVFVYIRKHVRMTVSVEKGVAAATLSIEGIRALTAFANAQNERIGNYMQANWSGDSLQLPTVLAALLDSLESDARAQGITADRTTLKSVIEASLRTHRVGKGREVREALEQVA